MKVTKIGILGSPKINTTSIEELVMGKIPNCEIAVINEIPDTIFYCKLKPTTLLSKCNPIAKSGKELRRERRKLKRKE